MNLHRNKIIRQCNMPFGWLQLAQETVRHRSVVAIMILIDPAISMLRPFSLISLCKFRTETSWIPTTNANKTRPSPRFKSFCCSKMALALFWNANVELPVRKPDDLTSHCLIAFRMEFHWVPPLNCNYIFILIFEDSCALLEVKAKNENLELINIINP